MSKSIKEIADLVSADFKVESIGDMLSLMEEKRVYIVRPHIGRHFLRCHLGTKILDLTLLSGKEQKELQENMEGLVVRAIPKEVDSKLRSLDISVRQELQRRAIGGTSFITHDELEKFLLYWEEKKATYFALRDQICDGYEEMECNRFLSNASGGKVSVEDLSMERKVTGWYINSENIVGLPSVIASALNSADSTDKYYDYKQMIHSILNYKQEHGEIPQYHMDFNWSGKQIQYL